jgi:choline-sulfatase
MLLLCLPAGIGCNRFQKPVGASSSGASPGASSDASAGVSAGVSPGTSSDASAVASSAPLSIMIRPSASKPQSNLQLKPQPTAKATPHVRPPRNVLLITIDTLRADHLGCYGYTGIQTPAIDALAKEGIRCEWAFTPVPITLPSHTSIMTGMYPVSHGVLNNGEYRLDKSVKTLAQILRQHGLATAAFVGAFVLSRQFGLDQGFEKYDDTLGPTQKGSHEAFSLYNERKGEMVTQACIQWLKDKNPDRFFIWVHFFDPHFPYDPPQAFKSACPDHPYDGEIAYTDHCVGLLLKELADRKVLEDTLVVLVADHGESLGEHRETTHGIFLYDATVRVPLILHYPGLHCADAEFLPQGSVISQPVKTLDILPTILDLLEIPHPAGLQGKGLLTYFASPPHPANPSDPPHSDEPSDDPLDDPLQVSGDAIFLETRFPEANFGWSRLEGVRTRRWKYIHAPRPELYDLSSDPHELHNMLDGIGGTKSHPPSIRYPLGHNPLDRSSLDHYPAQAQRLEKMLQSFLASVPRPKSSQVVEMDEVTRKRLEELGYVQTSRTAVQTDANLPANPFVNNHHALPHAPDDLPRDPKDMIETLAIFDRGSEEYSKGQYQSAIASFRQLLHQDTRNILARFLLAGALEKVGLFEESLEEFQKVSHQDTRFINVHNNLGNLYERLDKYEQTLAEYRMDIQLHPDNPLSYNNLGVIYLKHSLFQEAREQFEKLLLLNPDLPTQVVAHTNLGVACEMLGLYDNAQKEYQHSLQLDPGYSDACMGLGNIFLKKNKLDQAIAQWQKALEINPQNAEAHFNLGCTFMKQNRMDKAADHLQEAIQLEPNLWQARTLLERCRQQKNSSKALAPSL